MSSLIGIDMLPPGISAGDATTERTPVWGSPANLLWFGVDIVSTAVDARSNPTSVLQAGLVLGKITSSGKYRESLAANTDGSEVPVGVLYRGVNMKDNSGTATDKVGMMLVAGPLRALQVATLDANVRRYFKGRFIFDDDLNGSFGDFPRVVAKTADYTVTTADNNTMFTNLGAGGAVNFTLPALTAGMRWQFYCEAGQTITITAPAGKLVAFNNAAATSIAFSTASEKIGGMIEIKSNSDASKYLAIVSLGAETQTPTIA